MKALKHGFLLLVLILSLSPVCFSQQYTLRDQEEIAYQAQLTLKMYQDLLNVISYAELATESEIKELIRNSYTDSRSQLFYAAETIVEDNIKPSNLHSRHVQDKTIKDFLHYFDLTYEKSDEETIEFYDFEVSNLKYADYLYIKVKYTCFFNGKHKEDSAAYKAVDRVAEFRVEKRDNEWKALISSIVFYDPDKPVSSGEGDVAIDKSVADRDTFSRLTEKNNKENGKQASGSKQLERFSEQKEEQDSIFYYHLDAGKRALAAKNLEEAFVAFSEAEKIYPFNHDLRRNIMELTKAQNLTISSTEKRFEYAKLNADKAYNARDYIKAKNLYSEALRLKPEEEKLKVTIETLERMIQKIAILESKYAAGDYKGVIKDYNKAIKQDRNNPDYFYGRGRSYQKLNDVNEALKDYSKAIELDGNFIEALSSRAQLYVQTDQLHKAIADYTLILSNPDYAADFYPERARVKKMMGDLNGAIEDYNAAIRLSPRLADNYFEKGMILFSRKNFREAIRAFSEGMLKDPQHARAVYQRGLAHAALNDLQEASADFERARTLGLEEAQLAEINKIALNYYARGEGAMAEKMYNRAIENFDNALLISADFGRAWLRKGDAYVHLKDYDNALSSYDKAVEHNHVSFAYFNRGLAHQKKGDDQSAGNDFRRYVPIGVEVLARASKPDKEKRSAASLQEKFVEERADALYALGYAQLMTNQYVEALENLDMAIHARKFFPEAYFARGSAFYVMDEYKRAIRDMEESIKMGLSEPKVFFSLGKAYVANNQLKDAIFSYSHTLQLDPQYVAAYKERAFCYKNFSQYGLALEDIKAALSINEALREDVALMAQKGLLELYLNKLREARKSFDQALRLDETNGWALYGKACALAQEQKTEESMEFFRRAFQSREIDWSVIKKDPLINPVSKQKAFKDLVKAYL